MSICSMVIHSQPEKLDQVEQALNKMTAVEVRLRDERGKLVVLIDHPERKVVSDTMMNMYQVDGVLNASLIYEYFEEDDEADDIEVPFASNCAI